MFEKAIRGDRRYWTWVSLLGATMIAGGLAYLWQLQVGLTITGLSRDVTWGFYIAQFTFLVGVAASAVMVVLPYYLHNYKAFGKMTILGEFLAISAVIMCMLFIFVDMGMPNRILNVFLYPTPHSMMFWDTVMVIGYLLFNLFIGWATLGAERKGVAPPAWSKRPLLSSTTRESSSLRIWGRTLTAWRNTAPSEVSPSTMYLAAMSSTCFLMSERNCFCASAWSITCAAGAAPVSGTDAGGRRPRRPRGARNQTARRVRRRGSRRLRRRRDRGPPRRPRRRRSSRRPGRAPSLRRKLQARSGGGRTSRAPAPARGELRRRRSLRS